MRQLSSQRDIYSKYSWASLPLATVIATYSPSLAVDRVQATLQASGVQLVLFFLMFTKKQQACGASLYSPVKSITVKLYMISFVNNTSGSTTDFLIPKPPPLSHYANLTIHDAQQWNDNLQLSGGAREDSKCSYYFMYYEFTRNVQPVLKGGTFEPAILIRFNDNAPPTPIKQLSAYTSHKTLSMYRNPDGNSTATFRVLKEKNNTHTKTASHSPLIHTDVWAYYHAIYLPSIVYPFPSGSLQRTKCQHLQKQVKQAILPKKCGYNRNTPNAIVYGPSEYGGIEMRSHHTEQGIAQNILSHDLPQA